MQLTYFPSVDQYVAAMRKTHTSAGGGIEIFALSQSRKVNVHVYQVLGICHMVYVTLVIFKCVLKT